MSQKNLNVQNKTHKFLLNKLKDKRTLQIYKKFEKNLKIRKNTIVALSGGPDSLALSFLTKIYSLKKPLDVRYFIVDHRLRKNSTIEAKNVQKLLKNFFINLIEFKCSWIFIIQAFKTIRKRFLEMNRCRFICKNIYRFLII